MCSSKGKQTHLTFAGPPEVLGRGKLLQRCQIQWIGAKDEGGQGFHIRKGTLDHTLAVIRANPKPDEQTDTVTL